MRSRPRILATVAVAAVAAACSSTPTPTITEVPVAVAEPVPFEGTGLEPPRRPAPTPEREPDPAPTPSATTEDEEVPADGLDDTVLVGPTSADAARFTASDAPAGITGLQHVVVDLDGDGWAEVVATGMRDDVGVVRVAWWSTDGYEVLASGEAGRGSRIEDLRVSDVNRDQRTEVLVEVGGDGRQSLALWSVAGRGRLQALGADGGCNDGSHVYGVTRARLASQQDAPPVIVADCDESPLPVADWAEHRWAWEDGAYRFVPPPTPQPEDPGPPDDRGPEDPPGQGNGNDDDGSDDGDGGGAGEGRGGDGEDD